jgi:undecaprenyl-diphosphatase
MLAAWHRAERGAREQLLEMVLAVCIALLVAQVITHLWPRPRPFVLHLGNQYLQHDADPGLPSDHVTVLWSLAISALFTRRYGVWCFPLMAAGLAVGWCRVLLGVHFPFDVLAAFPVALTGALAARLLRRSSRRVAAPLLQVYERMERELRMRFLRRRHHD